MRKSVINPQPNEESKIDLHYLKSLVFSSEGDILSFQRCDLVGMFLHACREGYDLSREVRCGGFIASSHDG